MQNDAMNAIINVFGISLAFSGSHKPPAGRGMFLAGTDRRVVGGKHDGGRPAVARVTRRG